MDSVSAQGYKYGWFLLSVLVASPPLILAVAAALPKSLEGTNYLIKFTIFGSFLIIGISIITTIILVMKKQVSRKLTAFALIILSIYASMPLTLLANRIEAEKEKGNLTETQPKSILRTLLFSEPFYKMEKDKVEHLLSTVRKLSTGEHYIPVLRKLPPVPDGCPIIMKTLNNQEMVLVYFIIKRYEGPELNAGDKHVTLRFDSKKNLYVVEEAI